MPKGAGFRAAAPRGASPAPVTVAGPFKPRSLEHPDPCIHAETRRARTPLATMTAIAAHRAAVAAPAAAQVTIKTDGQWRHLVTAGVNVNSGNTESTRGQPVQRQRSATDTSKWSANAQLLYSSSNGKHRPANAHSSRRSTTPTCRGATFAFIQAAGLRDKPANISDRYSATSGLGLHLHATARTSSGTSGAASRCSRDNYVKPAVIDGSLRSSFNDAGLVLAEESNLKFGASTALKQKLVMPAAA